MKHTYIAILIYCCLCLTFTKVSQAQFIKAVLPIGFNFTQVDGDNLAGYNKVGLHAGVGAMIDLNEEQTWEAGFEILYNRLGSKSNTEEAYRVGSDLKYQYDYVTIPLLANYKDVGKGYLGGGLVYSQLVNNKLFVNQVETPDTMAVTKSIDIGGIFQIGFLFSQNFRITLRVGYSILPFLEPQARHNYVSIRFDTILNGLIKL